MIPTLHIARLTWLVRGSHRANAARVRRTERLGAALGPMVETRIGDPSLTCRHPRVA